MFEVTMSDEAKLAIKMVALGQTVPQGILDKALENARIKAMTLEENTAIAYVIDQLIKALETQDQELMLQVSELAATIYGNDNVAHKINELDIEKAAETLRPMMKEFTHAFVPDGMDKTERKLRMSVVKAMHEEMGLAPLCYHDDLLAFVSREDEAMVIYAYNTKKDEAAYDLMVERCAPKLKILREVGIIGENIEVLCGRLYTRMLSDGQFEMRCEEA